jgi:hypothetical protein
VADEPDVGPESFTGFYLHDGSDRDWFVFQVTDAMDGSAPRIEIALEGLAPENDTELEVWFRCTPTAEANVTCTTGRSIFDMVPGDRNDFYGCESTNPRGEDEAIVAEVSCPSGSRVTTWIRLYTFEDRWGSCAPYRLTRTIR